MKFDITQQSPFLSLVTLFVMSVVGLFSLLYANISSFPSISSPSLLGSYITEFQCSHHTGTAIIATFITFITVVWLSKVLSTLKLYGINTTIHIYTIGTALWCVVIGNDYLLSSIIIALIALSVGSLMRSIHSTHNNNIANIFNASLTLSLLPLLYTPSFVLWLSMIPIAFMMRLTLREVIASVIGLLVPIAGVVYIFWLCGANFADTIVAIGEMLISPIKLFNTDTIPLSRTIIFAILTLLSLMALLWINSDKPHKTLIRLRINAILIITAALSMFIPSSSSLLIALIASPLAIMASYGLINMRGRVSNTLFFVFILLLIISMFTKFDLHL